MKEVHQGEWVPVSKEIQDKYSSFKPKHLCLFNSEGDFKEYRGETENEFINIKTFVNYVSINIKETEYETHSDIEVVGALNLDRNIEAGEIMYYMGWNIHDIEYYELI